jgi:uncharacterized protein YjbI with pentapeptide repeats
MANREHLDLLKRGVRTWNQWRQEHANIEIDLSGADLREANLREADLSLAYLRGANLTGAYLRGANLRNADLYGANLSGANLSYVDLSYAVLITANLRSANFLSAYLNHADLSGADLSGAVLVYASPVAANLHSANLSGADLSRTILLETNFAEATLTNCNIYGIAAWNVKLKGATQNNLVITPEGEPTITVDNLEVAQFIYLLLNNPKIREVIDTVAKKAVLILGRFTSERKVVLDALKEALRTHGYLPILFDFDKPSSQDLTETVSILAHLSRFIIVDLTDPSSAPYEVGTIASNHVRPIQALFQPSDKAKRVFAMFPDLVRRYHWVLPPYQYKDQEHLLASLQTMVIEPAEQKAQELEKR